MEHEFCYPCAKVGQEAPDFTLNACLGNGEFKKIALADSRGKWTVLFFYPLDFTFICPTEIIGFSTRYAEFETLNAVVYGCSTDSVNSHKAWLKDLGELKTPLLSDMTHEVSAAYNVLIDDEGIALRGTFIIDPEGVLQYANTHSNRIGRSIDETLRILKALQTGELCPVNWHEGDKTLGKA
ncbi:peroxiredoxin [Candidatus Uhrbacteria bacterium]|nr:peroxiredoxin [Candidatus Uhrbacteria bacterium]